MTPRAWLAELSEAEAVARLLVEFRNHIGATRPSDNAVLAGVERLMDAMEAEYLLGCADDDSPPAGVAQLRYRFGIWRAAPDCWLEDLFVSESARGRGVGGALVEAALERARIRGCRRIELDVNEANVAALALYERFGFSAHTKHGAGRDLFLGRSLEPREP
ncbi:MAG TPA: GNAT family N-acetyltransferase [Solirubrobacteraceae bacterium]|jgi:GNAT superfamily N-acetyltransferase|nr:GNAT family N-acetyltransferase [Solirubrobacteraceae bacterium]